MNKLLLFTAGLTLMFSTACTSNIKKIEKPVASTETAKNGEGKLAAKTDKDKLDKTFKCQVGKDERVVLLDKEAKRCEVHYTKFGEKSQVAWAEATPSLCTDVYQKIRSNIEEKGFKCEAINPSVSSSKSPSKNTQAKTDSDRDTASTK